MTRTDELWRATGTSTTGYGSQLAGAIGHLKDALHSVLGRGALAT